MVRRLLVRCLVQLPRRTYSIAALAICLAWSTAAPGALPEPFLVKDVNPSVIGNTSNVGGFLTIGAITYLSDSGGRLWKTDWTAAGTLLVFSGKIPEWLTNVNGTLFFVSGDYLWKSNGTDSSTLPLKYSPPYVEYRMNDTLIGPPYIAFSFPSIRDLTNVNGTLFFSARDSFGNTGLWKSDGTTNGTVLVKDIIPGSGSSKNVNGTLFFTARDPTNGEELWKSDGTAAQTVLVKDINNGFASSRPQLLTNVNGTLFFTADDGVNGRELWKSDGTAAGTALVKDIYPGSGSSSPSQFTDVNGTIFFSASDPTNGEELWKSDGTEAGTVLAKDINSGNGSSFPSWLTEVNGRLFFSAFDGTNGSELWKSDGTAAGTALVKDIYPGSGSSSPSKFADVNGTIFFSATDLTNGEELWKSDGTAAGTALVKDINPGGSSNPRSLTNVNGMLFFLATDQTNSTELWGLDLAPPTSTITAPVAAEAISDTSCLVTGMAADIMCGVAIVEVSTDGGMTWVSAVDTSGNGTWSTWSYSWPISAVGGRTITARATDRSGNVQVPGTSATLLKTGIVNPAPGKTRPDLSDALRTLKIATGSATPTAVDMAQLDVAPLDSSGRPMGNNILDTYDVIGLLRMVVGLL